MQLGLALGSQGELDSALRLLEGCLRSVDRTLGCDHEWRVRILNALRDIAMLQGDMSRAAAIQAELFNCLKRRSGAHHPDTEKVSDRLAAMLFETEESDRKLT
jgi:Tetratricopeptide repeat